MKLSIITINYNDSDGLKKTLDSVAKQTFVDYEQIIIDGGSTDSSVSVIETFFSSTSQTVLWVSEKDKGVYNAQNKGIEIATGDYCLFLNSGDFLVDKNVLERVFAVNPSADIIYGNLIEVFEGKIVGVARGKTDVSFLDIYSGIVKHQAAFISRNLFEKYGQYDENLKIIADWEFFFMSIGFKGVTLHYVDVDISYFDSNGISYNNPELCKQERSRVLDKYMPALMQKDYLLFQKYKDVRVIDKSRFGWFLFRILAKLSK
jgi:glycosyltransferase involved in cell wall biosynthesis